jgi:hypothetical protein
MNKEKTQVIKRIGKYLITKTISYINNKNLETPEEEPEEEKKVLVNMLLLYRIILHKILLEEEGYEFQLKEVVIKNLLENMMEILKYENDVQLEMEIVNFFIVIFSTTVYYKNKKELKMNIFIENLLNLNINVIGKPKYNQRDIIGKDFAI